MAKLCKPNVWVTMMMGDDKGSQTEICKNPKIQ